MFFPTIAYGLQDAQPMLRRRYRLFSRRAAPVLRLIAPGARIMKNNFIDKADAPS